MEKYMPRRRARFGDRKDGTWLRDLDSMHCMGPYILRKRADREAFIQEDVDLTAANAYLDAKNAANPQFKYTLFQLICAAIVKTVVLRPHLNRFIAGRRYYQRNYLSVAFVAKKAFTDEAHESMMMIYLDGDTTIDTVNSAMEEKINGIRKEGKSDNSTDVMNILTRIPRPLLAVVAWILYALDYFGRVPWDIIREEPNYSSIFLTNLGSIKLNAGYHHLNNWGTNSIFLVVGEKSQRTAMNSQGEPETRECLNIGITLDELIADGYYYAQSVKLFRHLLQHPSLLERPAREEVDYA